MTILSIYIVCHSTLYMYLYVLADIWEPTITRIVYIRRPSAQSRAACSICSTYRERTLASTSISLVLRHAWLTSNLLRVWQIAVGSTWLNYRRIDHLVRPGRWIRHGAPGLSLLTAPAASHCRTCQEQPLFHLIPQIRFLIRPEWPSGATAGPSLTLFRAMCIRITSRTATDAECGSGARLSVAQTLALVWVVYVGRII